MFMGALVTTARKKNQHSFPSADKQIIKLWYNRFYSAIEEKDSDICREMDEKMVSEVG